jgi:glycosyltransferase involved in cell wall biosynthesis
LCGEGPQQSELEALRHKLGLDTDIYFTGFLPSTQVWALMKKAAVLISPSAWEGCPNTIIEAMACGCPLVISDIPAHREILDENSALFFDPSNIQQMVNDIFQALNDVNASKARCDNAREKTKALSISEMVRKYEKIYSEFI